MSGASSLANKDDDTLIMVDSLPNAVQKLMQMDQTPAEYHYPYILGGYRVNYTLVQCLRSIFSWHNETVNIWTHLLPLICFLVLCAFFLTEFLVHPMDALETVTVAVFFFGISVCLFVSCCFHIFKPISVDCQSCLLQFDMSGVAFNIVGNMFVMLYYGFFCEGNTQIAYFCTIPLYLLVGGVVSYHGSHKKHGWMIRVMGGLFLILLGLVPFIHIIFVMNAARWMEGFLPMVVALILCAVGLWFYASGWPERSFGHFCNKTYFFSHAIWHLFIVASQVTMTFTVVILHNMIHSPVYCENS